MKNYTKKNNFTANLIEKPCIKFINSNTFADKLFAGMTVNNNAYCL